jgi:hypothetical protein
MKCKDEKRTIIDIRSKEERQIEKDIDKSLGEVADGFVQELAEIGRTRRFVQVGHVVDGRAYGIGQVLHDMGGLNLMQAVCLRVMKLLKNNNARLLEYAWDGIGDWKA